MPTPQAPGLDTRTYHSPSEGPAPPLGYTGSGVARDVIPLTGGASASKLSPSPFHHLLTIPSNQRRPRKPGNAVSRETEDAVLAPPPPREPELFVPVFPFWRSDCKARTDCYLFLPDNGKSPANN